MKQSKEDKEFLSNIHEFNQVLHELGMKMIEILDIALNSLLDVLLGFNVVDAGELEAVRK